MNASKGNQVKPTATTSTATTATSTRSADMITSNSSCSCFPVVRSGRNAKESIINLDSWTRLVLTLDGRDKITKILQYTARFLAWYWQGASGGGTATASARFRVLQNSLTTSRKAYRLGRSLVEYQKLRTMGLLKQTLKYIQNYDSSDANTAVSAFTAVIGPAVKTIGLLLFWLGDNVNYLVGTGCLLDDVNNNASRRLRIQERAAMFANRSYFVSSVAGLLLNYHAYFSCQQRASRNATDKEEIEPDEDAKKRDEASRAKEFVLAIALIKSCCDVAVFSNNPGLDFWKKYYGKKLHEGLHCSLGIISALTVIYNAFPNADP